jgi:hypothetical protein
MISYILSEHSGIKLRIMVRGNSENFQTLGDWTIHLWMINGLLKKGRNKNSQNKMQMKI